jgi:hypothetical protein
VSSDLGKLDTKRQFRVGKLCAIAGAPKAVTPAATPAPTVAFFKNERLCIFISLPYIGVIDFDYCCLINAV